MIYPNSTYSMSYTPPTVEFHFNDIRFVALLDTGSQLSHIALKLARSLKLKVNYEMSSHSIGANNIPLQTVGTTKMNLVIGHKTISHIFRVQKELLTSCIIGDDILQMHRVVLDRDEKTFYFKDMPSKQYHCSKSKSIVFSLPNNICSISENSNEAKIQNLIQQFPTVFPTDGTIGQTDVIMHKIELDMTNPKALIPIKENCTWFPPTYQQKINEQIEDLLKHNKIRRSNSPYRFSVVLDDKKDGSIRMTVNYKRLNQLTIDNATPMHNANIILRLLPTGGVFSSLDLRSSFWQVVLHPESRNLTAFDANGVLYEWNVMPFGLKGSPSTYVMLMNQVLGPLIMKCVFVYIDDIVVFSRNMEEHLEHLRLVFDCLKNAKLTVNLKKSSFAQDRLEYLGHIVSADGLRKNPEKVRALVQMPAPCDKEGVKRLQGFLSWVVTFVPNFSTLFEPISRVMKSNVEFVWGHEQQKAFELLKKILSKDIVLQGLDYNYPVYLRTDTSEFGVGSAMCQEIDDKERVVCYASATLKD